MYTHTHTHTHKSSGGAGSNTWLGALKPLSPSS